MPLITDDPRDGTAAARRANMRNAAVRALDDPAELAKAARIVRAAIQRRRLRLADLEGDIVQPSDLERKEAADA